MTDQMNSTVPLAQVAEAVAATAVDHSPEQIVADIQTGLSLFLEFYQALGGLHPSVLNVIKFLL